MSDDFPGYEEIVGTPEQVRSDAAEIPAPGRKRMRGEGLRLFRYVFLDGPLAGQERTRRIGAGRFDVYHPDGTETNYVREPRSGWWDHLAFFKVEAEG